MQVVPLKQSELYFVFSLIVQMVVFFDWLSVVINLEGQRCGLVIGLL